MFKAKFIVKGVYVLGIVLLALAAPASAVEKVLDKDVVNKLQYMYSLYYLPFSLDFKVGKTINDILPFVPDKMGDGLRLIKPDELKKLDAEWNDIKSAYEEKSLLLQTPTPLGQTVRITDHLINHHINLNQSALGGLSLDERIQISKALAGHSSEVQASFKQLAFIKSLMRDQDYDKFNVFVVSSSWCQSCKEYRTLLENYFKVFPQRVVLHSIVIEDPKEEVFDKPLLKELFPHPKRYSHESIPMFLGLEYVNGRPNVYEEGEALQVIYERFLKSHRGYLDQRTTLFKHGKGAISAVEAGSDRLYSALK